MSQQVLNEKRSPEDLNDFINEFIGSNYKKTDESIAVNIDEQMNQIAHIYENIEDKIYFEILYEYAFVQRYLIFGKKSLEFEEKIIHEIRTIKPDFMSKYEYYSQIFNENDLMNTEYKGKTKIKENFEALVLNPFFFEHSNIEISTPTFSQPCSNFESYFEENHPKEKLDLIPELSLVQLSLKIDSQIASKEYTIVANLPQAIVLINISKNPLKFSQIKELLNNDKKIAQNIIKTLHEMKLIKRKGATQRLSDDDVFSINEAFHSEHDKIIIPFHFDNFFEKFLIEADYKKTDAACAALIRILKRMGKVEIEELKRLTIESISDFFMITPKIFERAFNRIEPFYTSSEVNGKTIIRYEP